MRVLVLLIIGVSLFACGKKAQRDGGDPTKLDGTLNRALLKKEEEREERIAQYKKDSLENELALANALEIAKDNFGDKPFKKAYEFVAEDSSNAIKVEVLIDDLFASSQKYLFVRRQSNSVTCLDLYRVDDGEVTPMVSDEWGTLNYLRDTIFDVNGDGHKDFLVHWYPSSGCCRRDIYDVYLNLSDKQSFSQPYDFINPTFSAKEGIIRGVQYGHPGEVGLYKYKWNGLQIDTLEFIYPDENNRGQFIKTPYRLVYKGGTKSYKSSIVLKAVPKEYHNIESYEWFSDF